MPYKMFLRPSFLPVRRLLLACVMSVSIPSASQTVDRGFTQRDWLGETEVAFEVSATASSGDYAPFWLTSNRYGLSSVQPDSYYERVRVERAAAHDKHRVWRLGYGLDAAIAFGQTRHAILQQAYVEAAWHKLHLTLGAKQRPLEQQNNELSSGALTYGINARPVPQVRVAMDWFAFPGTKGWWQWACHCSYGLKTDGLWQQKWTRDGERYTRHTLYHEKALHWRFGREDRFPLTYEIGLNMAAEFAGTSYNVSTQRSDGSMFVHTANLRAFWNALICGGNDETDGSEPNVEGNHLGSWVMQLNYKGQGWRARAYWERFFEDHSMLTVQYGIHDMLIGAELTMPRNPWVSNIVVEHVVTTDQSGPVYHDPTPHIGELIAGRDNYYNNLNYAGWQNYGMAIGNPLLTSPLYNDVFGCDHVLRFYNNRLKAWHLGVAGDPSCQWHWRALVTTSRNWGIYIVPFLDPLQQTSLLGEVTYKPEWAPGWSTTAALAWDHGKILGNSVGGQLTIVKSLTLRE